MQRSNLPHSPEHRFHPGATYMVTAATLYKQHFFRDSESVKFLESSLLEVAADYRWALEAWSVFSNHYHFVGQAGEGYGRWTG